MNKFNFVGGVHSDLSAKAFMVMDYGTTEGGTGHVGFICHKQPVLEQAIRGVIEENEFSELRVGSTIVSIAEDTEYVYVEYSSPDGIQRKMRAKFMVGADGKTGFTRKKYLEPKGILMEKCSQSVTLPDTMFARSCTDPGRTSYEETWVALNWQISLPTHKTHPDFPLWNLGYTPEDVFDLFFPSEFRFLCNPQRPAVCGRFGPPADRLWRFEFVVHDGEDPTAMAGPESTCKIIYPYITHPGSRYGLASPIQYPSDCIKTLRSRPFGFSARSCNKWALGRVILAGDAAHVFPPFGGQGIASGFRDASSLAWRLAVLSRNSLCVDHDRVLGAWYAERKQQLERSLAATIQNGAYVTESDPWKAFVRDWYIWAIQLIPSWKRELEKGPRKDGMIQYQYQSGMPFLPQYGGGVCFPQVYCAGLDSAQNAGRVAFTDDLIHSPTKEGLCQVVVLVDRADEIGSAVRALSGLAASSQGLVREDEATIFVHDFSAKVPVDSKMELGRRTQIARIATGQEFAADARLCKNRPAPRYYDAFRMKQEVHNKTFIIIRPDRFVYAACSNAEELQRAAKSMPQALTISPY